ncbi:MAG: acyclic terpene utilization AtuA family protein [Pseudomonadota bacterium]
MDNFIKPALIDRGRIDLVDKVLIGCGAGFAGDRFDAAEAILDAFEGERAPRYLMFECLGERTLALAAAARAADPAAGFSPYLDRYLAPILARAMAMGVRIVANLGAANPAGGAARVLALAAELGAPTPRVAWVEGDDLTATMSDAAIRAAPRLDGAALIDRPIRAANAYLGAAPVAEALATGADVVLVGRTTDSALALGPLIREFGWSDLDRLAAGVICGHLLECGAQVTGAYFADPGFKDVADLAHVGFPIAEVASDGVFTVGKPDGTGGRVDRATVTEQLLYEMHDPAAYLTPDATVDVTDVQLIETAPDRVRVEGVRGRAPPETLKATVCVDGGFLAEAEMSYAGPNAAARAELAAKIVEARMREAGIEARLGVDLLGAGGTFGRGVRRAPTRSEEVRLRLAMIADDRADAERLTEELQALYCSGPAAGGGFRARVTSEIATGSILVPRGAARPVVRTLGR